ncbi:hypothetical protein SPI_05815 [Niveomyces insectorum RCEF 264]|uniref:Uncharacterized protein n=1 Tax=Niveomyces insectorum RCEF 264 TaxID=1081102 RepID=A0A167SGX5_9HYPO|nr:hypothetical protein SPI_05815 [Niveomyces insectorum RCEF 264]
MKEDGKTDASFTVLTNKQHPGLLLYEAYNFTAASSLRYRNPAACGNGTGAAGVPARNVCCTFVCRQATITITAIVALPAALIVFDVFTLQKRYRRNKRISHHSDNDSHNDSGNDSHNDSGNDSDDDSDNNSDNNTLATTNHANNANNANNATHVPPPGLAVAADGEPEPTNLRPPADDNAPIPGPAKRPGHAPAGSPTKRNSHRVVDREAIRGNMGVQYWRERFEMAATGKYG